MFYLLLIPISYLIFIASVQSPELITADLGRHITNGKFIVNALANGLDLRTHTPLFTNFYSYTLPAQEAMNHHWLSGVVFHYLYEAFGFDGLELINIFCILAANLIFFFAAQKYSNKNIALLALIAFIPITCVRVEVRPESFSYLFMATEFLLITLFLKQKISKKLLFISIPLLQLIWINLHLFFIFGIFIICAQLLSFILSKDKENIKVFSQLLGLTIVTSLFNPAHILGVIEPLMIFKGYGYMIAENQSIFFMQKRFPNNPIDPYFEFLILLTLVSTFFNYKKIKLQEWTLALIIIIPITLAAFKTNRLMPVTAFYLIPFLASSIFHNVAGIRNELSKKTWDILIKISSIVLLIFFLYLYQFFFHRTIDKYKYDPAMDNSANFILVNSVPAPIFNNFDIGGYFIFHLFPKYRPFVDNRPEAYQTEFFRDIYLPMLESEDKWKKLSEALNLQTIYFMRHDATEHAQPFLIRRLQDSFWAPVYVDKWTIILVKRTDANQGLIKRYELPASMFKAVKT